MVAFVATYLRNLNYRFLYLTAGPLCDPPVHYHAQVKVTNFGKAAHFKKPDRLDHGQLMRRTALGIPHVCRGALEFLSFHFITVISLGNHAYTCTLSGSAWHRVTSNLVAQLKEC